MLEFFRQSPGLVHSLLDFVYPTLCGACGRYDDSFEGLCLECRQGITTFSDPVCLTCESAIDSEVTCRVCKDDGFPLFAFGVYEGPLRQAIVSFKYHAVFGISPWIAEKLAEKHKNCIASLNTTQLMPIPLHSSREYVRGFNQATSFAAALAENLDLPIDEETLIRTKRRRPQARLRNPGARRSNIAGAFAVTREASDREHVLLVDDVVTTGSTVSEAKKILTDGGFTVVGAVCMAHHSVWGKSTGK